jgi:hypothetical protein
MSYFLKNKDKLIASGLTFAGTPGQIAARAIYKKGSLDKPYLLLFGLPPFSIVPSIAMWLGWISDGEIDKPYDGLSFIAIGILFLIPLILFRVLNNSNLLYSPTKNYIGPLIQLAIIGIIYFVYSQRFTKLCPMVKSNKTTPNTTTSGSGASSALIHAILIAPLSLLFARLLIALVKYFIESYYMESFYDVFNLSIFKGLLDNDSNVDNGDMICLYLSNAVSFFLIYVLLNMYSSTKQNMSKLCTNQLNMQTIIIGIILNIFIPMLIKPSFNETLLPSVSDNN